MQRISLNFDWTFRPHDMAPGTPVDLPHDYLVSQPRDPRWGAASGYFPGGSGIYDRTLPPRADWQGRTLLLELDGAYMNSSISLNGHLLSKHPYGYTPWQVDLTDCFRPDRDNFLTVTTAVPLGSSRWYTGGGLYREVSLLVGGEQYLNPWDLYVKTRRADRDRAELLIEAELRNRAPDRRDAVLELCLLCGDTEAARGAWPVALPGGDSARVRHTLTVDHPRLWSPEEPNLYTLLCVLRDGDEILDRSEVPVGIRTIEIDARHGLRLNGAPLKLRGGCIHHDHGPLGAAAFPDAEARKAQILKNCGYNALRTAHNPPSRALLEACDRIGLLVLDESFDMWRMAKRPMDYHLYFDEWWQRDLNAMLRRDRNHPCIYAWSIGNEVTELLNVSGGARVTKMLADYVRTLDDRPVSASANDFPWKEPGTELPVSEPVGPTVRENGRPILNVPPKDDLWARQTLPCIQQLDLFGANYMYGRYPYDAKTFPDRVIHATESHPFYTYDYWQAVLENDNVIGDFIWTAFDNMGEAGMGAALYGEPDWKQLGAWPWLSCWQGDCDLTGRRRPISYFRKILWGLDGGVHLFTLDPDKTGLPLHGTGWHWEDLKRDWSFGPASVGRPVKLTAYADADSVVFSVNGRETEVPVTELKAELTVPYAPGRVSVRAVKAGRVTGEDTIETVEGPFALHLTPERTALPADGMSLCYIDVALRDPAGREAQRVPCEITAKAAGAAACIAVGSGDPCTEENYTDRRRLFEGHALLCLRAGRTPGPATVTVSAEGFETVEVTIEVKAP